MLRTRLDEQADIIIRQAKKIVELSTETLELKEDLDELNAFCDETEKLIVQHREEKAGLHQRVEDLERKLEIQDEKIEYLMVSSLKSTADSTCANCVWCLTESNRLAVALTEGL